VHDVGDDAIYRNYCADDEMDLGIYTFFLEYVVKLRIIVLRR
jgi:hypothetical protein